MKKGESKILRLPLDEVSAERFKVVKEYFGVNSNQSVIGVLVSAEYDRIQARKLHKVFLPKETYEKAEKAAEARNQTLYEYIEELALDMIKKAEEGVQHAEN